MRNMFNPDLRRDNVGTDTVKSILMKETYISADTYITRVVGNSKRDSYTLEGGDPKSINSDDEGNGFLTGHHSKQSMFHWGMQCKLNKQ